MSHETMINSIHYTFAPKDADLVASLFRELTSQASIFSASFVNGVRPLAQERNAERAVPI